MSRIRYIKPGFFTNEDLGDCQPLARLLFAGLWCIADREGRLEDRPRRIHVEILPYDDCDCDALLNELRAHGLIVRYSVGGQRYIAIPSWSHHQHPHQRESESTLPSPDEAAQDGTRQDETPPKRTQSTTKAVPRHSQGDDEPGSNGEWVMGNGLTHLSSAEAPDVCESTDVAVIEPCGSFDDFYLPYPRHEARKDAEKAWRSLKPDDRAKAVGVAGVMRTLFDAGAAPERDKIPLPSTFLRGERWNDWAEGIPPRWGQSGDAKRDDLDAFMRSYAAERGLEYEPV